MPIKMVWDPQLEDGLGGGGYVPRFFCDYCKEPIDDAERGIVTWTRPLGEGMGIPEDHRPTVSEIAYFAHQGHCDEVLQTAEKARGNYTLWCSLLDFPLQMANNSTPESRRPPFTRIVVPSPEHPRYESLREHD